MDTSAIKVLDNDTREARQSLGKRGEMKGDLYLVVKIEFPEDGWLEDDSSYETLQKLLPLPAPPIEVEEVDDVHYESIARIY